MDIKQNILNLMRSRKSLCLSTTNSDGSVDASYAPFYFDGLQQRFIILVSGLSQHTSNLINQPEAAVLFIEDESETEQIFARKRLSYQIQAQLLEDKMELDIATGAMLEKFGEIINMLTSLPDFKFFILTPKNGRYIEGFGKAFDIQSGLTDDIVPAMQAKK